MKLFTSLLILIGLILVVLGVNIIYQPEMLVPVVATVFIIFGALLFILGLVVSRVSSMASGLMGGGAFGAAASSKGGKASGGIKVFKADGSIQHK